MDRFDDNGNEKDEINAALSAGAVGAGRRTAQLESRFAAFIGVLHAVAVNSCWAGFHLALEALDLHPGDEIITSIAASPPAIAAVTHIGARPVVVDVDPVTLTLDVGHARRKCTERTRAIVPGHFAGCPAAMDEVRALAAEREIVVVEDAVHALPAWYHDRIVGSIGDVGVFSLAPDTEITTGEGAILTTDRDDFAERFRTRRFYGLPVRDAPPLIARERVRYEAARTHGFGYQIADVNAAIGLAQLTKVETSHAIRSYYAGLYEFGLSDLEPLVLPQTPPGVRHAWGLYVVRVRSKRPSISRDMLIASIERHGGAACVDFVPLYAHRYYGGLLGLDARDFPAAREAYEAAFSLRIGPRMTEAAVWDTIRAVRRSVHETFIA